MKQDFSSKIVEAEVVIEVLREENMPRIQLDSSVADIKVVIIMDSISTRKGIIDQSTSKLNHKCNKRNQKEISKLIHLLNLSTEPSLTLTK